ncbi:MAG: hypothetical protein D6685_01525 [Bacteroidetes bacterium]|nr:MAG: hypothetical protein D6685_01525 [Bacteroidota bacterium]
MSFGAWSPPQGSGGGGGSTPTLADVLASGNTSGGNHIVLAAGDEVQGQSAAAGSNASGSDATLRGGAGDGTGDGGFVLLYGGSPGASGTGGGIDLLAADGAASGGDVTIICGSGTGTNASGGSVDIRAGAGTGTQAGGGVSLAAGANASGTGSPGNVTIAAGNGNATQAGGYVQLTAGDSATAGMAGTIRLNSGVSGRVISDTLTADVDDYSPAGIDRATMVRIDGGASVRTITGIARVAYTELADARLLIANVGTFKGLKLTHEDASSVAENRFALPDGLPYTINPGATVELRYDSVSQRWRVLG